jgi:hypothetical protein
LTTAAPEPHRQKRRLYSICQFYRSPTPRTPMNMAIRGTATIIKKARGGVRCRSTYTSAAKAKQHWMSLTLTTSHKSTTTGGGRGRICVFSRFAVGTKLVGIRLKSLRSCEDEEEDETRRHSSALCRVTSRSLLSRWRKRPKSHAMEHPSLIVAGTCITLDGRSFSLGH